MKKSRNLRGKALIEYKNSLKLTSIQREILIGTLLGDATMPLNYGKPAYYIKFEQHSAKAEYIYHLYEIFKPFVGTPPRIRNIIGRPRQSIWFRTYKHPALKFYDDLFYTTQDRKKRVPKNINKFLTAKNLTYWFMDDGSFNKKNKYLTLNTQSFSLEDQKRLVQTLKKNLNICFQIYRDRDKYYLMTRDLQQFKQLDYKINW